eukprot:Seg3891.2 transcript_id=Seg3891.2/GoldUCD/mRNA.D3Y31 product="E3 ubiquitin-protein ligase TOM1-like" protein_id=Seg3891.2/GoldUCD/D3Y31
MSKQRKLLPIEAKTAEELRDLKYQGVTIICSESTIPPNVAATYQGYQGSALSEEAVASSPPPPSFVNNLEAQVLATANQAVPSFFNQPSLSSSPTEVLHQNRNVLGESLWQDSRPPLLISEDNGQAFENILSVPLSQPSMVSAILTPVTATTSHIEGQRNTVQQSSHTNLSPSVSETIRNRNIQLDFIDGSRSERRSFRDQSKPQEVYAVVRQIFDTESDFLLVMQDQNTHLPRHSNLSLFQWQVKDGAYVIIRDIDNFLGLPDLNDDEHNDDEHDDDLPDEGARTTTEIAAAFSRMKSKRQEIVQTFSATQQLLVRRQYVVQDAIAQYHDATIVHSRLYVRFEGETGDDFDGLTREFFSIFWSDFTQKLPGNARRYFAVDPCSVMSIDDLKAVGRILVHGFLLTGYLPIYINHSLLYKVLTGNEPSLEYCRENFLLALDEMDKSLIDQATTTEAFSDDIKNRLAAVLCNFGVRVLPSEKSLPGVLMSLGHYIAIIKPHFYIASMHTAIEEFQRGVFKDINEPLFKAILEGILPSGRQLIPRLQFHYSDDHIAKALEETVAGFVESYLLGVNKEELGNFLEYVTGSEMLPESLRIEFNGQCNEESMIPTAHTCSMSLHISRYFLSYNHFQTIMKNMLLSKSLWRRFDMI